MTPDHAALVGRLGLEDATGWREQAACRDHDPEVFFPGRQATPGQIAAAKAICATCLVQEDCLAYALETNQTEGIWGGQTPTGRRKLRRRWLEVRQAS
jgi:WhiB family redox-sensing transcriptional regulator